MPLSWLEATLRLAKQVTIDLKKGEPDGRYAYTTFQMLVGNRIQQKVADANPNHCTWK